MFENDKGLIQWDLVLLGATIKQTIIHKNYNVKTALCFIYFKKMD